MGSQATHRAREILAAVGRAYPHAWRTVDRMLAERGKGLPAWPDWCFLPLHGAYAIVSGGWNQRVPFERAHHTGILGALAAWRVTQGIYRFDPALYAALIETELDAALPRDPLYRLPEWCVYIETPDLVWQLGGELRPLHGVWAHLDWDERGDDELRLVLDTALSAELALDPLYGCIPLPLILGEGTIADALARVVRSGAQVAQQRGMDVPAELLDANAVARALWPVVSLLLYLCADDAEMGDGSARPANPAPIRTRHGWRHFPPDAARTWDVGVRLGAALRRAYHAEQTEHAHETTGRTLRPHIRRAHWHTFLAGPRSAKRERRIKWLPPIAVKLDDPGQLPATVRPVRGG